MSVSWLTDDDADRLLWFAIGYLNCAERRSNYLSHIINKDEWVEFNDEFDLHFVTNEDENGVWGTSVTAHDRERKHELWLV